MKLPWISRARHEEAVASFKETRSADSAHIANVAYMLNEVKTSYFDKLNSHEKEVEGLQQQIVQLRLERDEALNRLLELAIGTPLFPTKEPEEVTVAAKDDDDHEGISAPQQRNIRRQMQSMSRTNKANFNTGDTGALVKKAMELRRADMQREAQERAAKQVTEGAVQ